MNWRTCGIILGAIVIILFALTLWIRSRNRELASRSDELTGLALQALNEKAPGINAESVYLDVGGNRFHLVTAGPDDGRPVVLLHGFPEQWHSWKNQILSLAKAGYRVIADETVEFLVPIMRARSRK